MSEGGENLKIKQSVNKQYILELLEKSNSVEQHVYYQKGESPEKIQQYYLGGKGQEIMGGATMTAPSTKPTIQPVKSGLSFPEKKRPNVLRTIYMPNFEVDQARDQIDILRKEIDEEQKFYQQVMKEMQDEKGVFEEHQR